MDITPQDDQSFNSDLTKFAQLTVAILVFYVLYLPGSVYVTYRHGLRGLPTTTWLIGLALIRIIGAACYIAAETTDITNPSEFDALFTVGAVGNIAGIFFLLFCISGLILRPHVHLLLVRPQVEPNTALLRSLFHLFSWIAKILTAGAFILAIFAAAKLGIGASYDFRRAFAIILLFAWLHYIAMTLLLWRQMPNVLGFDRGIVNTLTLIWPIFFLPVLYYLLAAYWENSPNFTILEPNVYFHAFLLTVPEFVIALLLLACLSQLLIMGYGPIPAELTVEQAVRLGWPEIRVLLPAEKGIVGGDDILPAHPVPVRPLHNDVDDDAISADSIPVASPQQHRDLTPTMPHPI
ncbi:hypothetical protein BT63DRAFT_477326 [Microthyrium microscopicum]|uniref:DUF7702 domain-containing protein n=1 Tax=Microthyrium microscopicum TaxID=703497 RepID=A0A6A6UHZ5_9PEZI|nr:hypothetical protein BT63DRAFT_477326 [Microthyrium microscopicum]